MHGRRVYLAVLPIADTKYLAPGGYGTMAQNDNCVRRIRAWCEAGVGGGGVVGNGAEQRTKPLSPANEKKNSRLRKTRLEKRYRVYTSIVQ